ncbi:hypothetical protein Acr_06g0007940 [Actinidia rufa]|uniref:FLZ-type domain-containing protein n=1 Tax=Actinidia rufa TaxID=165716 RepID=A0A7J0EQU3_9ERIC|nr:hypothetical protein Acr_06g0007940 [Actinidia rufa]
MGHLICGSITESCFHSDVLGQKQKTSSFFNVPGLFVEFSPKASESDSVRNPTSPLDYRVFPNLTNPFRSPRSPNKEHQKIWGCTKVGLSIIHSLNEEAKQSGKILRSSDSKNILFELQMRIRMSNFQSSVDSFPKSLPKTYGVFPHTHIKKPSNLPMGNSDYLFDIGETKFEPEPFGRLLSCSLDSRRFGSGLTSLMNRSTNSSSVNIGLVNGLNPVNSPPHLCGGNQILGDSSATYLNTVSACVGLAHGFIGSLSASEIELSEDYTCNEEQTIQFPPSVAVEHSEIPTPYPSSNFLSFCYSCQKKLEGEDIYMYRFATIVSMVVLGFMDSKRTDLASLIQEMYFLTQFPILEILIEEAMERTIDASPRKQYFHYYMKDSGGCFRPSY